MELDKILKGFRSKWPKNIFLKGFTNSPERYLKDSDILILPSRREGFCNTIIEAGACGIPTIAYEIYGVKTNFSKFMLRMPVSDVLNQINENYRPNVIKQKIKR